MKRHEIRERFDLGGAGSGHRGHRGIPGQVGGSMSAVSQVRGIVTVPEAMDDKDVINEQTLERACVAIANSDMINLDKNPTSIFIWRVTGKRKQKVEFSVTYPDHPLGIPGPFHTNKISIPMGEK